MKLLSLAIFLLVLWLVLRLALAMTGAFLHIIWILAVILFIFWLIGKFRGGTAK